MSNKPLEEWPTTAEGICRATDELVRSVSGNEVAVIGLEAWLARNGGEAFEHHPRPEDIPAMAPQQCYRNAFLLACERPGLTYCEGIVCWTGLPVPIAHAWCINEAGKVVDPTLETASDEEGGLKGGLTYFGVRFEDEDVEQVTFEAGTFGVLDKAAGRKLVEDRRLLDQARASLS